MTRTASYGPLYETVHVHGRQRLKHPGKRTLQRAWLLHARGDHALIDLLPCTL